MRASAVLLVAVALSVPATAPATTLKPWVGFNGSLGKYSMGDLNRDLDAMNVELIGTPLHLWPIGSGPGCGMSAGVGFGPSFSLGVGYDRVFASSGVVNPTTYVKARVPANAFRGTVEYAFPRRGPLGAYVGAAAGKLMVIGQFVGRSALDLRGSAPLVEVYLGGDWWGQPRCGLFATVGYRSARVKEVKTRGQVELNPDGSKYRLDYSGSLMRLGLKIPLTAPQSAAAPTATGGAKPWIGLNASYAGYQMTDVNGLTGLGLKKISGGPGFGATAGLDFPGHVALGVGYDRLAASSQSSHAGASPKFLMPANAFRGFVEYRLPSRGHLGLRLGVAGGTVMEAGSAATAFTEPAGTTETLRLKGSGALIEGYGSGEWQATPRIAATATLGYRHAKVGELKEAGVVLFKPNGLPLTADYSGVIARIGLKFALTK